MNFTAHQQNPSADLSMHDIIKYLWPYRCKRSYDATDVFDLAQQSCKNQIFQNIQPFQVRFWRFNAPHPTKNQSHWILAACHCCDHFYTPCTTATIHNSVLNTVDKIMTYCIFRSMQFSTVSLSSRHDAIVEHCYSIHACNPLSRSISAACWSFVRSPACSAKFSVPCILNVVTSKSNNNYQQWKQKYIRIIFVDWICLFEFNAKALKPNAIQIHATYCICVCVCVWERVRA